MACAGAARGCAGGGGSIQASRQVYARVAIAAAAVAGGAGIAAAVVVPAGENRASIAVVAIAAVVGLAVAVARPLPSLVPWPLAVLGGTYAWRLGGGGIDQWAPALAAAFLGVAELAYWSTELRQGALDSVQLVERRVAWIAGLSLGAFLLGAIMLAATAVPVGSGIGADALGVAAAVAAFALVAAAARRLG